jgi:CRISPR-associated protein Csm3
LNIFDTDNENQLKDTLDAAMKLLEDDYLGGNGSRGYGQIVFSNVKTEEKVY